MAEEVNDEKSINMGKEVGLSFSVPDSTAVRREMMLWHDVRSLSTMSWHLGVMRNVSRLKLGAVTSWSRRRLWTKMLEQCNRQCSIAKVKPEPMVMCRLIWPGLSTNCIGSEARRLSILLMSSVQASSRKVCSVVFVSMPTASRQMVEAMTM